MRNKEKSEHQGAKKPSRSKSKKIRERAGELAMNHGKRPQEADQTEVQRAKRELLDMQITSPKP